MTSDLCDRLNGCVELVRGVRLCTPHDYWPVGSGMGSLGTMTAKSGSFAAG